MRARGGRSAITIISILRVWRRGYSAIQLTTWLWSQEGLIKNLLVYASMFQDDWGQQEGTKQDGMGHC